MLTPKIILSLVAMATAVSAAPPHNLVTRQDASYGDCTMCSSALGEFVPYCHYKPEEECQKACTDQFLKPLAQCATCIASDTTANAAGKALVDSWVTGMDTTCNPKVTMYGKCNTCEAALRELSPFCHGQTTAECNKACTGQYLDPLKTCSDCISGDNTASKEGKDLVSQWQTHMDTECNAKGGSCDSQCSAIRPDLEAKCGSSGNDISGCRELCQRYDSAYSCTNCIQAIGGLPDLLGWSWGALQWYCSNGCGSTCTGVVDQINSQCKDEASCKTTMCSGDAKSNLDECNKCLSGAPISSSHKDMIQQGITSVVELCGKATSSPDPTKGNKCEAECTSILNKNVELCQSGDQTKCKGMCSDDNLSALDKCNACASGPDSALDATTKTSINNNLSSLRIWCKDNKNTKPNEPVVGTVPAPPTPLTTGGTVSPPGGVSIGGPPTTSGGAKAPVSGTSLSSAQYVSSGTMGATIGFVVAVVAAVMG